MSKDLIQKGPPSAQLPTIRAADQEPLEGRRPQLLVIAAGEASTHPLPELGEVVIGRAAECTVPIDDPSISRRHAVLRLGPPMTIEDLGSANGTRLRDQPLEPGHPASLGLGEVVDLGSVMITVQLGASRSAPRRIWSHDYFEVRVEDECARAARDRGELALLRVQVDPGADALVPPALGELLRPDDVVGHYAPGIYEVLLVDATSGDALELVGRASAALREVAPSLRVGIASYPRDGTNAYELAAVAAAGLGPLTPADAPDVVIQDLGMRQLYRLLERVAIGEISVLLLGETGVGKEVIASRLHQLSRRKDGPLLRLNCAALPEHLIESELFGHLKGAFTGAATAKPGLLESADGGTVFLDEVGELPMAVQVKLLRVLEDRQVLKVGAVRPEPVNVRFIAATNRDLEGEVARGTFRQDLYFRLAGATLPIPPLRQRPGELVPLAQLFIAQASRALNRPPPGLSADVLGVLRNYGWPGNIRELKNVIERAVLLCEGSTIERAHLPVEKMTAPTYSPAPPAERPAAPQAPQNGGPSSSKAQTQRQRILDALEKTAGNQKEAAVLLGVSRRTLSDWLDRYAISRPRKRH